MKQSFTLAEVLITLGIIGVVAAITMPTIIHNAQMKVHQNQFKKAYSLLSTAIEKAKYDIDTYDIRCSSTNVDECRLFHNALENNLKIIKKCNGNAYNNGCIADVKGVNDIKKDVNSSFTEKIGNYGRFHTRYLKDNDYAFVTVNGLTVVYYERNSRAIYWVDTNGLKGPNKYGYDIFMFGYKSGNKLECVFDGLFEAGGKSCSYMLTGK